jgi:hypothetical protein
MSVAPRFHHGFLKVDIGGGPDRWPSAQDLLEVGQRHRAKRTARRPERASLKVRTAFKAGRLAGNHNRTLL